MHELSFQGDKFHLAVNLLLGTEDKPDKPTTRWAIHDFPSYLFSNKGSGTPASKRIKKKKKSHSVDFKYQIHALKMDS